ncbi:MAG: superoxide dismutase [Gammaproteobacteria bacterium]|nr:superoxide dismutase [Gammaproteobacteria bacterium]
MTFELPALPYSMGALAPHISEETLEYHYGKHHQAYVNNLNKLIEGTPFEKASLEDIIRQATGPLFNNAAQVWNHTFYWHCLSPDSGKEPVGAIKTAIDTTFGSFAQFKEEFTKAAATAFGSAWTWLVKTQAGELKIVTTFNAGTPMTEGNQALLTCDVWEHAYYIDYRNRRPDYLNAFWELVNWDYVNEQYV